MWEMVDFKKWNMGRYVELKVEGRGITEVEDEKIIRKGKSYGAEIGFIKMKEGRQGEELN